MNQQNIPIDQIRIDGGTQPRESLNEEIIAQYAADMDAGEIFPPVAVFHDGAAYWLADGFHRYHAARKIARRDIAADVHSGTRREAILHSVGANGAHGLRRNNADKRKAVLTLLKDAEWSCWPQARIAMACAVSREFVSRMAGQEPLTCDRSQVRTPGDAGNLPAPPDVPQEAREKSREIEAEGGRPRFVQTKHGTVTAMDTARIGRSPKRLGTPRISAKALEPIRPHSLPRPMRALSLPYDPVMSARTLYELFERSYIEGLIAELSHLLATEPPPSLPQTAA